MDADDHFVADVQANDRHGFLVRAFDVWSRQLSQGASVASPASTPRRAEALLDEALRAQIGGRPRFSFSAAMHRLVRAPPKPPKPCLGTLVLT